MILRKKKIKGRVIVLFLKKDRKFFVGTSAVAIAKEVKDTVKTMHYMTVTRVARAAEEAQDGIYENRNLMCFCTTNFIKARNASGGFGYRRR